MRKPRFTGDFTDRELFVLELLKEHLNARFFSESNLNLTQAENTRLQQAIIRYELSLREAEILKIITQGMPNEEISTALSIAPSTLKKHIQHIYEKTDIHSRIKLSALSLPGELQ